MSRKEQEIDVQIDEDVTKKGPVGLKVVIENPDLEIEVTDIRSDASPEDVWNKLHDTGMVEIDEGNEQVGRAILSASFRVPGCPAKSKWRDKFEE